MPTEGSHCIYLSLILIDSVLKIGKDYYLQVFLEECKYIVNERKMSKSIDDNSEISSDESYGEVSCKET